MGRFEKRPDNPRVRGELSRTAETALWAIVEDLENLQQNVLRSLQEEIKRLQGEKDRLAVEIQQLIEEKEHLQHVRQITEQQVLIRQLAEALAKHICSQLQSSLTTLASQVIETSSQERAALSSAQNSKNSTIQNNENTEQLLGTLDDTLTIAFNSLQQELKNYQSDISQQLSRMYSQQQQGEAILEQFTNNLREELTKTLKEASKAAVISPTTVVQPSEQPAQSSPQTKPASVQIVTVSPPTVLQPLEQPQESSPQTKPELVKAVTSPNTVLQPPEPLQESSLQTKPELVEAVKSPNTVLQPPEQPQESSPQTYPLLAEVTKSTAEPTTNISQELSQSNTESSPSVSETVLATVSEPISVLSRDLSEDETTSEKPKETVIEPTSVSPKNSSGENKPPSVQKNTKEPISVLNRDLSNSGTKSPPPAPATKPRRTSSPPRSLGSSTLSPIQIGFLLVVLSTVLTSLYNVAIKQMFYQASEIAGVMAEGLISPTLGNIFLILTLRLMVVVPLMILLAPIMYPQVWQDLQNLITSTRSSSTPGNAKNQQKILQLSIASGCFLFLSQVLIYLAIGQIATGTVIALFFVYPLFNGLLSWFLFRDRPNSFRAIAIGSIFCGELLVFGSSVSSGIENIPLAATTAIFAGLAFACYVILTRMCATKVHPVSFTLINFSTMLALSFIGLMLPLPETWSLIVEQSKLLEIVLSAFILGVLTLSSYVFNHVGIGKLGASRAAIIGAGVPILTVIFAGLMLQETLDIVQILGVLFVTFGVAAFSFEKMRSGVKASSQ
ncbi:EamA family transporter [Nostoc sp. CENA67]|uniref:EamA family transporter n=1 Tax=Amazonocrinis nigriterrae CENA67 TaxID=2794033 RepID=A0A8J7HUX0_9NOST|nr:DMT family transporter [Amazonocrinis nigriterrae]MBH8564048.1 EamA family transporter [Amazonocrinis nigriterrae CENA67]